MEKRILKQLIIALVLMGTLLLVGCRSAPIYNVIDMPVYTSVESYTAEDVKQAIIRAGVSLGWRITESAPGKLVGVLNLRRHMAKIDIPYSKQGYSLLYNDSNELIYNPDKGEIHAKYNGWIQRLDRVIRSNLSML